MAENWCSEHKTAWFKKGKMKGFAHPILDDEGNPTGEWCNKPEEESKAKSGEKYQPRPSGHTPEERASIENQVRAKIIAELWISKTLDRDSVLVHKLIDWLNALGEISISQAKISPVSKEAIPTTPPQPKGVVTATTGAEKQGEEVIHITVKDLVDIAKEKGYDSSNVTAIIVRHFKKAKASELNQEQIDWLYNQLKDGKLKVDKKKQ